jgi:hypothetical protein
MKKGKVQLKAEVEGFLTAGLHNRSTAALFFGLQHFRTATLQHLLWPRQYVFDCSTAALLVTH